MAKKEIEHTSTTLGNQDMKGSQRMVSVVEPYELPDGGSGCDKDIATRIRFYYVKSVAIVKEKIKWQRKK